MGISLDKETRDIGSRCLLASLRLFASIWLVYIMEGSSKGRINNMGGFWERPRFHVLHANNRVHHFLYGSCSKEMTTWR